MWIVWFASEKEKITLSWLLNLFGSQNEQVLLKQKCVEIVVKQFGCC